MSRSAPDLEAFYLRHAGTVFRRARHLLKNEAEAHEVVQDLFLSLLERPDQVQEGRSVTGWFYTATTHACLNRLRNQHNRRRLRAAQGPAPEADGKLGPDAMALLHDALCNLPPPLAEVAVYYFLDELSQEEIAPLIGCSRRQVSVLIERLRAWGREQEATCSNR
jgi:RNA polymerase sigma-70 factor (ECF subfamily)